MRIPTHLLLRVLMPASLLLGIGGGAHAEDAHEHMNMAMPAGAPAACTISASRCADSPDGTKA
mgnify:CR=1 FL=1